MTCIGEPVSWPRLERFAAGSGEPAVAAHVEACPACRACLDSIRADVVALPPLVAVAAAPVRRRRWLAPAMAAAMAALVALVVIVRRPPAFAVGIKGVGEVSLALVRERHGELSFDARRYAPGDRWKVVVSCAPGPEVAVDVSVADGATVDHPLAGRLACGNRVPVPGAFTLTGAAPNRICVRVAGGEGRGEACATILPE